MNTILRKIKGLTCVVAAISIAMLTFSPVLAKRTPPRVSAKAAAFTSDAVVLEWNQIAFTTIPAAPPFPANRFMATVQVAVFEAVNAATGKY